MNKVIGINLNGNVYQVEEPGFAALSAYLAEAKESLEGNPDQAEIIADLEQAIADKIRHYLSAHKSVVTDAEVTTIIRDMGPVNAESSSDAGASAKKETSHGPKRLYRIEDGEYIGGVANGLAAYLDIDVAIVRVTFVVLLILTSGGFVFAYLLAWIFIPPARTQQEWAAASGKPFNTEEIIARAKAEYTKFGSTSSDWKRQWKDWKKDMKHQSRQNEAWKRYSRRELKKYHRNPLEGLGTLILISFLAWLGYHHVTAIHDFLDAVWNLWHRVADQFATFIVDHDKN